MKIIIPAAGQGTRLRPHTHTLPKVLLPVAGRPIIGHILADIAPLAPDEVRLVVGYKGELVDAYARDAFPDLPVRAVWQREQLGLGHAVLQALDPDDRGPVLVILGDTVFDVDYLGVAASPDHVLAVRAVPDPERFGIVELDAAGETIVRLVEKPAEPKGNLALVGLYFVRQAEKLREALQSLVDDDARTRGEYQLTDGLQRLIDAGERFVPWPVSGWFDCGKAETLLDTNRVLLDRMAAVGRPGAASDQTGSDANGHVTIVQPVLIGPDCVLKNAVIGPYVSLSRGASIRDAVIRDSIVGERASVEGLVLERSIIGPDARVSGRPQTLNVGDGSEITC